MVRRRLAKYALAFVALLVVAAGSGWLWLRTSLPVRDGTITLAGLQGSVNITRDRYGIPTIKATNQHDADFALGFVHAQDRLFSMDMMRRYGAGRLSEIFGARTLPIDRAMRVFGLYRAAESQYATLAPAERARSSTPMPTASTHSWRRAQGHCRQNIIWSVPGPRRGAPLIRWSGARSWISSSARISAAS